MSYESYLKSADWKAKRTRKLNRHGGKKRRCAICAATERLHVHHLIYRERLEDAKDNDLRILCEECHKAAHKLFREGKLKFSNRNPGSRFTLTKNAVKKFLGLKASNMFWPTNKAVESKATPRGGYTKKQLAEWGIPWPPPKGWKKKLEKQES